MKKLLLRCRKLLLSLLLVNVCTWNSSLAPPSSMITDKHVPYPRAWIWHLWDINLPNSKFFWSHLTTDQRHSSCICWNRTEFASNCLRRRVLMVAHTQLPHLDFWFFKTEKSFGPNGVICCPLPSLLFPQWNGILRFSSKFNQQVGRKFLKYNPGVLISWPFPLTTRWHYFLIFQPILPRFLSTSTSPWHQLAFWMLRSSGYQFLTSIQKWNY